MPVQPRRKFHQRLRIVARAKHKQRRRRRHILHIKFLRALRLPRLESFVGQRFGSAARFAFAPKPHRARLIQ